MGIKIIQEGLNLREIPYDGTCIGCGSVLQWTHGDVYSAEIAAKTEPTPASQIACPVCKTTVVGYQKTFDLPAVKPSTRFRWPAPSVAVSEVEPSEGAE